jgi:hypothetical protein
VLPTKTRRLARVALLPAFVARVLRVHRKAQEAERLAPGPRWPDLGYVFTAPIGTPIDPRNCTRLVQTAVRERACRRCGCMISGTAASGCCWRSASRPGP